MYKFFFFFFLLFLLLFWPIRSKQIQDIKYQLLLPNIPLLHSRFKRNLNNNNKKSSFHNSALVARPDWSHSSLNITEHRFRLEQYFFWSVITVHNGVCEEQQACITHVETERSGCLWKEKTGNTRNAWAKMFTCQQVGKFLKGTTGPLRTFRILIWPEMKARSTALL